MTKEQVAITFNTLAKLQGDLIVQAKKMEEAKKRSEEIQKEMTAQLKATWKHADSTPLWVFLADVFQEYSK